MRTISSSWTYLYKWVLPCYWFGLTSLGTIACVIAAIRNDVPPGSVLIPIGLAVVGFLFMHFTRVFSFADEVSWDGDDILVRYGSREDRFPVANILATRPSAWANPERIVLTLSVPCRFGSEIVFLPPFRWVRISRHPLADELVRRANEARQTQPVDHLPGANAGNVMAAPAGKPAG